MNFLLGTLALAVLSLLVGEFTSFLASFVVRRHFEQVTGEAKRYQDLSMEALKAGDRPAYEAANKLANEAFGKSFYSQVALSATFVWPIFFALGWMQHRFLEVDVPPAVHRFFPGLYRGFHSPLYRGLFRLQAGEAEDALLSPHQGVEGRLRSIGPEPEKLR